MTTTPQDASGDRVVIFDTTLRDGEQCPGATMTFEEKLEVADCLDTMGVDIIEAGFPIASEGDFEAVTAIAKRVKRATVAGLASAADNRSSCVKPITALSGVRISWLTRERNSVLARVASSAACLSRSACSAKC